MKQVIVAADVRRLKFKAPEARDICRNRRATVASSIGVVRDELITPRLLARWSLDESGLLAVSMASHGRNLNEIYYAAWRGYFDTSYKF
jgi:hypothetical protein